MNRSTAGTSDPRMGMPSGGYYGQTPAQRQRQGLIDGTGDLFKTVGRFLKRGNILKNLAGKKKKRSSITGRGMGSMGGMRTLRRRD